MIILEKAADERLSIYHIKDEFRRCLSDHLQWDFLSYLISACDLSLMANGTTDMAGRALDFYAIFRLW